MSWLMFCTYAERLRFTKMPISFGPPFAHGRILRLALSSRTWHAVAMGRRRRDEAGRQVRGMKYLRQLMPLLDRLHESGCARDRAGNRRLFFDQYASLVLLGLFTPAVGSMRDLCRLSELRNVQKTLGVTRVSAGSFSESGHVFDPSLLLGVIDELSPQLKVLTPDARLPADVRATLTLVDGTLLKALPGIARSMYAPGPGGSVQHGWKLHTQLDLCTFAPERVGLTEPTASEAQALLDSLRPGRCYVMDRGYGRYDLLDRISEVGSHYVCRLRDDCVRTPIETWPPSQAARSAGVIGDTLVRLGGVKQVSRPVRLVEVKSTPRPPRGRTKGYNGGHASSGTILIATDLLELPAEAVALIYQYRWTIEIFFRFLKHLLGCRHLFSNHPNAIAIQVYLAVIACMLVNLWTGRRINKATWQMLFWYFSGWAELDEVEAFLNKPDHTGVKNRARDERWKKLGIL